MELRPAQFLSIMKVKGHSAGNALSDRNKKWSELKTKMQVLISAPYMLPVIDRYRSWLASLGIRLTVPAVCERLEESELLSLIGDVDGAICGDDRFTARVLEAAPRLRVISKWGTGIDSIDLVAARRLGIQVRNTPGAFTEPVADTVLGYVLAFARRIPWATGSMRAGDWEKLPSVSLRETTLGIIGVGNIGSAVARRAKAFGMSIMGTDIRPIPNEVISETGMVVTSLDQLLATSDFVSVNCDLNSSSYHLLHEARLSQMKPTAVLINTARGPIVDETALIEALQGKRLAGAALDVFEHEPLPQASPLRTMENVLLGAHNSNSSPFAWERVHQNTLDNLLEGLGLQARVPRSMVFHKTDETNTLQSRQSGNGFATSATRNRPDAAPAAGGKVAEHIRPETVEAVVIEGPGQASFKRVAMPELREDEVLIKVACVGVCGTDLEIYRGTLGYFQNGLATYPIIPGHEVSGRVAAVGSAVSGWREGDPVVVECIQSCGYCFQCERQNWIGCADRRELGVLRANGGYAQYMIVPNRFLHRLGSNVDLVRAALCEPLAVVLKGLRGLGRNWLNGDRKECAVIGAGPLGRLGAAVLQQGGHSVTLFDSDARRVEDAEMAGFGASLNLEGLDRFDTLIEATGALPALETVLRESAPGSTILLLGLPYAPAQFNFETLVAYDKTVVGSVGSTAGDFDRAIELLPLLDLAPLVELVMPLERYAEAWEIFGRRERLKIILSVDDARTEDA